MALRSIPAVRRKTGTDHVFSGSHFPRGRVPRDAGYAASSMKSTCTASNGNSIRALLELGRKAISGATINLLGLTFKENVTDL